MSIAATFSHQGDGYQLLVALHWLIQLLRPDGKIAFMQVESNGIPGDSQAVVVDDVVVVYQDGRRCYMQAKKNHPNYETWQIKDPVLRVELGKALQQLEGNPQASVCFYSRSPFGELQKLAEAIHAYPDYATFELDAPTTTLKPTFAELCTLWDREPESAFGLASRLEYAFSRSFDEWNQVNRDDLGRLVPRAADALRILKEMLTDHQEKLRPGRHIIRREDILAKLEKEGIYPAPYWDEKDSLDRFSSASRIGREWGRDVGGHTFTRQAITDLREAIKQRSNRIVLTDGPGTGKTCVLLDLMDVLEQEPGMVPLFIRGDSFDTAREEKDLTERGLPDKMVGRCARLAENRQVVVIVDSLDVLSLQRDHGALTLFLGLMDRLARIPGLSVVAACRRFDLEYHTHLRGRKWDATVTIGPLDWQEDVVPILKRWGVNLENFPQELRNLLLIPQNLRLFHDLRYVATVSSVRSAYQLNNLFLHHLVAGDPNLGDAAMDALQKMAMGMMEQREKRLPLASWQGSGEVRQRLISKGILYDAGAETLAFTHQTLRDNLLVRGALRGESDLTVFVGRLPPLPFVRPAIRAFVLHLVAVRPNSLGRQVTQVLSNQQVPYHIRRLIAETLAEIEPDPDADWPWINRLFREKPEIFERMFLKIRNDAWFRLLHDKWWPVLGSRPDRDKWRLKFLWCLDFWMHRFPSECMVLWLEALAREWEGRAQVVWTLSIGLNAFTQWSLPGSRAILEQVMTLDERREPLVGKAISRYVEETNQGDDLLWAFICRDVTPENLISLSYNEILHCLPDHFYDDAFLEKRFVNAEALLNMAVATLEEWAAHLSDNESGLVVDCFQEISWRLRHKKRDTTHVSSLSVLLDAIETALHSHMDNDTLWWQDNEPRLRTCRSLALRYLLIQAYTCQPERHVEGIACQLADEFLQQYSGIFYAMGKLVNAAAPYMKICVLDAYQRAILNRFEKIAEEDRESIQVNRWCCEWLFWIPCIFRTVDVQAFLDRHATVFGHALPEPKIWTMGGWVQAPVTVEMLNGFSKDGIIQFLRYYEHVEHRYDPWDCLIGGKGSVESVLCDAASINPLRYLVLLAEEVLEKGYVESIVNGVVNHVRYRFGNSQPANGGWTPVEPLPAAESLARRLLDLLGWHPEWLWCGATGSNILQACADVLVDPKDTAQMTALFALSIYNPDPASVREQGDESLVMQCINSSRGIAARAAAHLAAKLLQVESVLPEGLMKVLEQFAGDPMPAVRLGVLQELPVIIHHKQSLGRNLFDTIFREEQGALWANAYYVFYYNHRQHFNWLEPYMERMCREAPDKSMDSWARIVSLATLTGHITFETLMMRLHDKNNEQAWKGAAAVFRSNLADHQWRALCKRGLGELLRLEHMPDSFLPELQWMFGDKDCHPYIPVPFGEQFIVRVTPKDNHCDLHGFFSWLAFLAGRDPLSALGLCERLMKHLSGLERCRIWSADDLFVTLTSLFREADDTGDEPFIQRVAVLQDDILQLEIYKKEEWLQEAERL